MEPLPPSPPAPGVTARRSVVLATAVGGLLRFWWTISGHWPAWHLDGEMHEHIGRVYAFLAPSVPQRWLIYATHGLESLATLVLQLKFYDKGCVEFLGPVQALLATAAIPLAAAGAGRWFGRRAAPWTAWLLALDGLAIGATGYFLPDAYANFFAALSFALLRPDRLDSSLFAGLALALGGWFDPSLFALIPLWAIALPFARRSHGNRAFFAGPLLLLGSLPVAIPAGRAALRLGVLQPVPWRTVGHQIAVAFLHSRAFGNPLMGTGALPWAWPSDLLVAFGLVPLALVELWRHRKELAFWIGVGLPLLAVAAAAGAFGTGPRTREPFDLFVLAAASVPLAALAESGAAARLKARLPTGARRHLALSLALLVLASAFMTLPLWLGQWFTSHEWDRYLARLVEYVRLWREGNLFPRWCTDCYGGYGSPLFDFQPPGVFAPSALWSLLGASPATAYKITLVLATCLGSVGTFLLVRGETRRTDAGLLGALAFTFAPYQFMNLFMRGDLSEVMALAFFPMTLFLYRECLRAPLPRVPWLGLGGALCHAGIVLSHTITGQWTTEILAVALLPGVVGLVRRRDFRRLLAGALTLTAAMGLSAIYVVPALLEKKLVYLERITTGYFTATRHLVPAWRFFRFWYYDFVEDGFDGDKVRMPFCIGLPLILAIGFAAVALWRRRSRDGMRRALPWWLGFAAVLWIMTPQSAPVWKHLPLASFIEFPWRLLGPASLLGAIALGATWAALVPPDGRRFRRAVPAALAILAAGLPMQRVGGYLNLKDLRATPEAVQRPVDQGMTSADEHLPRTVKGVPSGPRKQLFTPVPSVAGMVGVTQTGGTEYAVRAQVKRAPLDVDLALHDFAGWKAETLSGPVPAVEQTSPVGLVRLHLASAGSYAVRVFFDGTPARTAGTAISLACLLLLLPLLKLIVRGATLPVREPAALPPTLALEP